MIKYLFVGLISFILLDDKAGCLGSPDPLDDKTLEDAKKNGPSGSGGNTFKPGSMNLVYNPGDECLIKTYKDASSNDVAIIGFNIYGQMGPYLISDTRMQGNWKNAAINCDIYLGANGIGTWHWKPSYTQQDKMDNIKWGVALNKNGTMPGGPNACYVLIVHESCIDLIDAQFGMGTFTFSNSSWSTGWTR